MKDMKFLSLLLLLGILNTSAQPTLKRVDGSVIRAATLDTALPNIMRQAGVIGLNIAVVNGAMPVYHGVFGWRDREAALPPDTNTVFEAASLTKPLFAYLVMGLVKEKIVHLDTPLYKYLEYKDITHDPRHKLVTARMVLSHSSGLPSGRNGCRMEFVYDPGKYFNYSPEGYFYLQLIVEKLLNKNLETIMKERVFDPLGMTHSTLVWTEIAEKNHTIGYDYLENKRVEKWKPDKASAMSSLQTTAGDYARFLREMMTAAILGKEQQKQMLTPQVEVISRDSTLWWSLGFGVDKTTSKPAYYQWGSNYGAQNLVVFYPEQQIGVVYFVNNEHGLQIKDDVLELTIGGKYSTDKFLTYDQYNSLTRRLTKAYDQNGIEQTLDTFRRFQKIHQSMITNRQLDELAGHVLNKANSNDAVRILKLNTSLYPKSWKTHAALAEAYLKQNDQQNYLGSLLKAIKYSPNPELLLHPLQQTGIKWR
jgi:CubicO group peptidase (beta-lactamase class C family)